MLQPFNNKYLSRFVIFSIYFNLQNGFGIHHKLTDEQFTLTPASKMRNQLAIEVLDRNMLYLMKIYQTALQDPERLG
jgi:hypothetical protein